MLPSGCISYSIPTVSCRGGNVLVATMSLRGIVDVRLAPSTIVLDSSEISIRRFLRFLVMISRALLVARGSRGSSSEKSSIRGAKEFFARSMRSRSSIRFLVYKSMAGGVFEVTRSFILFDLFSLVISPSLSLSLLSSVSSSSSGSLSRLR